MKKRAGLVLGAQCTIVYADADVGGFQDPAIVANSFACAAQDSLSVGQFQVTLRALSAHDVRRSIYALPTGHERWMQSSTMVLLGTGAMLAIIEINVFAAETCFAAKSSPIKGVRM